MLKVRKGPSSRQPPSQALLESRVWEPVLGPLPNDAAGGADYSAVMARELLYVQRCLMPLLGAENVPEQVRLAATAPPLCCLQNSHRMPASLREAQGLLWAGVTQCLLLLKRSTHYKL